MEFKEKIFIFVEIKFIKIMSRYKLNETVTTRTNEYGEVISETVSKSWKVEKDSEPFFLTYVKAIS